MHSKRLPLLLLPFLFTGCSWFGAAELSTEEAQEMVFRTLTAFYEESSYRSQTVMEMGMEVSDGTTGNFRMNDETEMMRVSDRTRNQSGATTVEFDFTTTETDMSVQGTAELSARIVYNVVYLQVKNFTLSIDGADVPPETEQQMRDAIQPYLNQWISIPTSSGSMMSPESFNIQGFVDLYNSMNPDGTEITSAQVEQIKTLTKETDFLLVTTDPTMDSLSGVDVYVIETALNREGILNYIRTISTIIDLGISPDEMSEFEKGLNDIFDALHHTITFSIGTDDEKLYRLVVEGELDSKEIDLRPTEDALEPEVTATIHFMADTMISDYGKTFTISEPTEEVVPYETLLLGIMSMGFEEGFEETDPFLEEESVNLPLLEIPAESLQPALR